MDSGAKAVDGPHSRHYEIEPVGGKYWSGFTRTYAERLERIRKRRVKNQAPGKSLFGTASKIHRSLSDLDRRIMPHVIVKLWPGKSEQQKTRLAEAITKDVMGIFNYGEEAVSVAMEEIRPDEWAEKVYKQDILNKPDTIYKKPGYAM